MKKFLLSAVVTALFFCNFTACSPTSQWSREERQSLREMLRDYRRMVYLNNLTEAEYMLFSDNVASAIETAYPLYTTFIEMPAVNDTVQYYVVTTIVEQLNTDARNMRHIFPYKMLVADSILPSGLDRIQQNAFYKCLSQRVNQTYPTLEDFIYAVAADTTSNSAVANLQRQCASELFGWTVEIVEVDVVN
ncbi:MAG: hypothetical protein IKC42_01320 [Alistipes sp.]|nr:hypothetical protein [Alistipes sp.]